MQCRARPGVVVTCVDVLICDQVAKLPVTTTPNSDLRLGQRICVFHRIPSYSLVRGFGSAKFIKCSSCLEASGERQGSTPEVCCKPKLCKASFRELACARMCIVGKAHQSTLNVLVKSKTDQKGFTAEGCLCCLLYFVIA